MQNKILTLKPLAEHCSKKGILRLVEECPMCQFHDVFATHRGGRLVRGDWRKAIFSLTSDLSREPDRILKENVNDWINHAPCIVLPKGTEFFHVTGGDVSTPGAHWVNRSLIGDSLNDDASDKYTFFTAEKYGFARHHRNDISVRIKTRLMTDLHGFFLPAYDKVHIYGWEPVQAHVVERRSAHQMSPWEPDVLISCEKTETPGKYLVTRTSRRPGYEVRGFATEQLTLNRPELGGPMARAILSTWPHNLRPNFFVGSSECEYVFHNRILHSVMKVTGIATSDSGFERTGPGSRKIMPFDRIPAAMGHTIPPGLAMVPPWIRPSENHRRISAIRNAVKTKRMEDQRLAQLFA